MGANLQVSGRFRNQIMKMKVFHQLIVFLFAACSLVQGEEKERKSQEMDTSIALGHYKSLSDKVTNHAGWPDKYFEGYPQSVTLPKEVNSLEDVSALLNERPQMFKDNDKVTEVIEKEGFFIVAVHYDWQALGVGNGQKVLVKAYVIKKGTKSVFCWMNW